MVRLKLLVFKFDPITVSPVELVYIDVEETVIVNVGDTLVITCNTSAGPDTHLEWIRNGEEIRDSCIYNSSGT